MKKTAADHGMKPGQLRVLWAIRLLTPYSTATVAGLYATRLQAPTRLRASISALVAAGFVSRSRNSSRQHLLRITPKGEKLLQDSVYCLQSRAWE